MSDIRVAVIDAKSMVVENIIVLNEKSDWKPPEGTIALQSDKAAIGDEYNKISKTFTPADPVAVTPTDYTADQFLAMVEQAKDVDALKYILIKVIKASLLGDYSIGKDDVIPVPTPVVLG